MSKSEGSLISISDPPNIVYEKVMNTIPDGMVPSIFEMCTEVSLKEINPKEDKESHEKLAFELTRMFHSEEDAKKAREVFSKTAKHLNKQQVPLEGPQLVTSIIVGLGIVKNNAEARGLINQGVVQKNGSLLKKVVEVNVSDEIKVGNRVWIEFVEKK